MLKNICKLALSKVYFPMQSKITEDIARNTLNKFNPKPEGCIYTSNSINLYYDLQIIIPAYNAEKYLNACLDSVISQESEYRTLVTVVNDGSTDSTSIILDNISMKSVGGKQIEIEIINQSNKGYSGARNAALRNIRGTYVMFLDSDDILPSNTIKVMLDAAYKENIDILQGSWYSFNEEKRENTILKDIDLDSKNVYISGYPWGKIFKYSVLKNFQFPEGFWFEDTPISFMIAALPVRIATVKNIIYGYRLNPEGITAKAIYSNKSIDSYWITEQCLEDFPLFDLQYDQRAYEYFLRQTLMNACRICNQPRKVREAVFVMESYLKHKYFEELRTQNPKMKKLEKAIENRRFIQFELLKLHI